MTYKCVPVPQVMAVGKDQSHGAVVKAYEDIINKEAAGGWEYVAVDSITSVYEGGCLAQIPIIKEFVKKPEANSFKVIVFKKA